jgi:hypothetical protein
MEGEIGSPVTFPPRDANPVVSQAFAMVSIVAEFAPKADTQLYACSVR